MKEDKHIRCAQSREHLTDWLQNRLSKAEQMDMNMHLAECLECQEEFAADKQLWDSLGKMSVPEPGPAMRLNFYDMLEEFKAAEQKTPRFSWQALLERIQELVVPQWAIQLGFSLLLVALGAAIGYKVTQRNSQAAAYQQQIETLAAQVQDMKSTMMLSLIENPSATERLRAVSYTSEIAQADERVIDALFTTLNNDDNVNVRLVTLEALMQYADNPLVRSGLVKSLSKQESPMVQAALADVMVKLQEKRSIKALKSLLRKEGLDNLVKNKIEQSIKDLS
ncbi:HEAT repeat domain-containing protein [Dyadobacter sp. Leaf189]|uniref:HEAT repeat domain-containing protein n=1 Tax=Dyadobacter sp. Leaf189 TaxID=1736295 RepID=UPI0006FB01C5|nr:HEAT repeat domain-containing protein [Dyadobacter sp. Leaf189]KQS28178.1 anti-sigma factor [Dyadobacter sp. Leaf189]